MAQLVNLLRHNCSIATMNYFRKNGAFFCRFLSTPVESNKSNPKTEAEIHSPFKANHKVDNFEKKLLVWSGKYKSTDEVPAYVNQDVMEKARNRFRIRTANIMMILTVIGCLYMVFSGKQAQERGESVLKMNQDWHKEYNDKMQAEAQAAIESAKANNRK
jgi:hypothetical protein